MKRSLRSWLWRIPIEQEIDEELALHVEMRTRELVERGVDPAIARERALSRLGDIAALKRTMTRVGRKRDREMRLTVWLEELRDDVTFAFRQLRRAPGFAVVATLTLALGIGRRNRDRPDPGRRRRTVDRDAAVWGPPARSNDVRPGDDRARHHRRVVDCRTSLASGAG